MSKKITILPQIRNLPFLTKLEKKIASEITRFTTQGKWFYKSLNTFSQELQSTPKSVKKTYCKLKSNGFMETKKDFVDRRIFNYKMTKLFFDKISEFELEIDEEFATFNPPISNQSVTENHPKSNRQSSDKYKNTPTSPNVEAPKKVFNIEGIKDLNNKGIKLEKEKEKSKNLTRQQNILNENLEALENFEKELFENLNQKDWIINKKSESQVWNEEKAKANLELIFDKIKVWMTENPKKLNENPKVKTRFNQFAEKSEIGWIYPIKITYQNQGIKFNPTKLDPNNREKCSYYEKIDQEAEIISV